ncbi:DUF732 domain-containing protein [Microbacterium dauci]|uniref:DUF732 domain-containing protein n=1 Tax=Microbacterium dauci TaxID=3048008 RepID=A0ABT6ZAQ7_9MICO|nr:DUF732 domain-containing protein [Microbacterium sp. LX3-4]MDJ1113244.1 DUF732 domain-containing protein [Microbacterium sp. LX3-4]
MMKRSAAVLGTVLLAVMLAGCAGPVEGTAPEGDVEISAEATEGLVAETPEVETGEQAFLDEVRANLRPENVIPNATDEQLLDAGEQACEAIANGADTSTLSLIDGESTDVSGYYPDSATIIVAARQALCD